MFPSKHILYSFILCLVFYIILPYGEIFPYIIIFLSSVLIDIDHYFIYVYRKKDFSLLNSWRWHMMLNKNEKERNKEIPFLHIFHTFEFILLTFILSFFFKIFLWIFFGLIFHSFLDLKDMKRRKLYNTREYLLIKALLKR
ncbi:MAG: hypothetical protein QW117_01415 [Candidatus Pacearchaeota archaeon]